MSDLLRLSQGVFVTFTGTKFQVGHLDAPYYVHEIGRDVLQILAIFAEPTDPDTVLSRLKGKDEVRAALAAFLEKLRGEGVLITADKPQASVDRKNLVFEVARATEVYSDIGRLYPEFREAWRRVEPQTLTTMPLGLALWNACRYITTARIPGAIVECGVWHGGSALLAALALLHYDSKERAFFLYDIFEWSWEAPVGADGFLLSHVEQEAAKAEGRPAGGSLTSEEWERQVVMKLVGAGYPEQNVRTVRGRVEQTIPAVAPEQIALLRLDTDYYDSTLHELQQLYPRLAPGGVLLVDDYGRLEGSTRAVDEYFAREGVRMMLNRIDAQGCIGIKQAW